MKKAFIISFMMLLCSASFGQTYFYKYLHTVDKETGVKTKKSGNFDMYVTFTNGKQYCYVSDENGMAAKYGGETLTYQGQSNNIHDYMSKSIYTPERHFYFAKDFSRLNTWTNPVPHAEQQWNRINLKDFGGGDTVNVFERREAPEKEDNNRPNMLW